MSALTFTRPPRALRWARPDNLALVPASLLPFKAAYQQIANQQPIGTTLIILPSDGKQRDTLSTVATLLRAKKRQVSLLQENLFSRRGTTNAARTRSVQPESDCRCSLRH